MSDGPAVPRVPRDGIFKQNLQWSPAGGRLLFTRLFKGQMGLWTVPDAGRTAAPPASRQPGGS